MSGRKRAIEILLVEDNANDRLMTAAALSTTHVLNNLHSVEDGVETRRSLPTYGVEARRSSPTYGVEARCSSPT